MRKFILTSVAMTLFTSVGSYAAPLPGQGKVVKPIQSTITEETFQTLLVSRALDRRSGTNRIKKQFYY